MRKFDARKKKEQKSKAEPDRGSFRRRVSEGAVSLAKNTLDLVRRVSPPVARKITHDPDQSVLKVVESSLKASFVELSQDLSKINVVVPVSLEKFSLRYCGSSPALDLEGCFASQVCGKSISLYPFIPGTRTKLGSPICDSFLFKAFGHDCVILVVTDGCGWGLLAREAAVKAKYSFSEYVERYLPATPNDTMGVARLLIDACAFAHLSIMEGNGDESPAGTTTILGGVIVPTASGSDQYTFTYISVGDCKAYHLFNGTLVDLVPQSRCDPKDPGGRLGAHLEGGLPDFRNLIIGCIPCNSSDVILLVTDGVSDNFDAQFTDCSDGCKMMLETIGSNDPCPQRVVSSLLEHCEKITERSRSWLDEHPKERLPCDVGKFPGKLDHATCLCIKLDRFTIM